MASNATKMVTIDGELMEGGGQVIRNSISLSALLGIPIKIINVRAKRDRPGLQAQHMTGIQLVSEMYSARTVGVEIKSKQVIFEPGKHRIGEFIADTRTAGSICLLLQIALPCAIFGSIHEGETFIKLGGGTNASNAPQIDYFIYVFTPIVKQFGVTFDLQLIKRGYYPKGKGLAYFKCRTLAQGKQLSPLVIERQGELKSVTIYAHSAGRMPADEAENAANAAHEMLKEKFEGIETKIEVNHETKQTSFGDGGGITVIAITSTGCVLAGSALWIEGVNGYSMGSDAANQLIKNVEYGGGLDEYAQDQVIIFMALAQGKSRVKVGPLELHTETSIHFTSILTGAKFTVTPVPSDQYERPETERSFFIECEGIGYTSIPNTSKQSSLSSSSSSKSLGKNR